MAGKPVSTTQFWWGIAANIVVSTVAAGVAYAATYHQIRAQRAENQRSQDSQQLKDISMAVSGVGQQLRGHALALMQFEGCIKQRKATMQRCRGTLNTFDAGKLFDAWATLEATVNAATPLLISGKEAPLLDELKAAREKHTASIDPLLPANSAESASAIQMKTTITMDRLKDIEKELLAAVAERARKK